VDLEDIIGKHIEWKIKFRRALDNKERLDVNKIMQDDSCSVGKWLYSEGDKYARFPSYMTLIKKHAEFHKHAAQVALEANAGNVGVVDRMLAPGSPYNSAFSEISIAVRKLMKEAGL